MCLDLSFPATKEGCKRQDEEKPRQATCRTLLLEPQRKHGEAYQKRTGRQTPHGKQQQVEKQESANHPGAAGLTTPLSC